MALIACPDCGHKVSDQAPSCPSCGHPLGRRPGGKATVIEQTAKSWKKVQIFGVVGMLLGLLLLFLLADADGYSLIAPVVIVLGLGLYVVGRVGAWWHHG